jgi:O-antigen/teichoic acid export membrane protein
MPTAREPDDTGQAASGGRETLKVATGAGTILVGRVLSGAIHYAYAVIIANVLGAKSFGAFMLALTIINLAAVFSSLGLESGVVRFVSLYNGIGDRERVKGTIVQSLVLSFLLGALTAALLYFAGAPLLARLFDKPEIGPIIKLLVLSLPFLSLLAIAVASTQGFQLMRYTVYGRDLFWPLSNLLLVFVLMAVGYELGAVTAAYVASTVLAAGLSLDYVRRVFPEMTGTSAVYETKRLLRFSIPLILSVLLNFVIMWTDTLMLGRFRPSEDVGIYNAAMKTAMLTSVVLVSFNSIFAPMISNLSNLGKMQMLEGLFKIVTKWINTISVAVFLLIVLLSSEILTLFGQDFVMGRSPLLVLATAQLVNAGVGSVALMLAMTGRQNLVMYITSGVCALNILLNYLLIPPYGMLGASLATGASVILMNLLFLLAVYRLLRMHPYNARFFKSIAFGLVAFGVVVGVKWLLAGQGGLLRLVVCTPAFLAVYGGLMLRWGLADEDREVMRSVRAKYFTDSEA